MSAVGPIGRVGRWTADHVRVVVVAWVVIAVGLGAFAPRAEHALSGAGWEAAASDSVAAREAIDETFRDPACDHDPRGRPACRKGRTRPTLR